MNPPAMCQLVFPQETDGPPPSARFERRNLTDSRRGSHSRRQPGVKKSPQTATTGPVWVRLRPVARHRGPGASMIEIRRQDTDTTCAVCGRTVLLGERLVSFRTDRAGGRAGVRAVRRPGRRPGLDAGGRAGPAGAAGARREERGLRALLRPRKRRRDGAGAVRPRAAARGSGGRGRGRPRAVQREHASAHRLGHRPHAGRPTRERRSPQPPRGGRHGGLGPVLVPVPGRHAGRADGDAAAPRRGAGRAGRAVLRVERAGRARRHRRARA